MQTEFQTQSDRRKALIEENVRHKWAHATMRWDKEGGDTEVNTMRVRNDGEHYCFTFTYEALSGLDDNDNLPRIRAAMRKALRDCESGRKRVDIQSDWLGYF